MQAQRRRNSPTLSMIRRSRGGRQNQYGNVPKRVVTLERLELRLVDVITQPNSIASTCRHSGER
jgi:hypothetical protein